MKLKEVPTGYINTPVQLPEEQSEMMELAARLVSDDRSAKALIAIVQKIASTDDFTVRDELATSVVRGAYLMTVDFSKSLHRFCGG